MNIENTRTLYRNEHRNRSKMITRAPRVESNFYILDKQISEDSRLTWAARGLLIYLLGKKDNWEVSIANLRNQTENTVKPTKRDGIYNIINELISSGYMKRVDSERTGGKFTGINYLVSEVPCTVLPDTVETDPSEPDTDKPYTVLPDTVETIQVSNDIKQELISSNNGVKQEIASAQSPKPVKAKKEKINPSIKLLSDFGVDGTLANDFLHLRREKRAPITKTALDGIKSEAEKAGITFVDAIRICCVKSWQSFNSEWDWPGKNKTHSGAQKNTPDTLPVSTGYQPSIFAQVLNPSYCAELNAIDSKSTRV